MAVPLHPVSPATDERRQSCVPTRARAGPLLTGHRGVLIGVVRANETCVASSSPCLHTRMDAEMKCCSCATRWLVKVTLEKWPRNSKNGLHTTRAASSKYFCVTKAMLCTRYCPLRHAPHAFPASCSHPCTCTAKNCGRWAERVGAHEEKSQAIAPYSCMIGTAIYGRDLYLKCCQVGCAAKSLALLPTARRAPKSLNSC